MISIAKYVAGFFCLVLPAIAQAQSAGIVECPRSGDYVYLYSSMTTLDVRITLQCGEQVQITGRYDRYFGVRTAKGEIGYVPHQGTATKSRAARERAYSVRRARQTR